MNDENDFNERFEELIRRWEPIARAWLAAHGVQPSDQDEIIHNTYVAFLQRRNRESWPDDPLAYLFRILWRGWGRYFAKNRKAGRPMPQLPELPCPPADGKVDAMLDLRFFLDCYAKRRPTEAHALRVWLIKHQSDAEAAACELIEDEGGDPNDEKRVVQVKRRLSAYLARFGAWLVGDFPDYVD